MSEATDSILKALRGFGLAYPGAHSKAPWPEHDDLAVNDKTFAYLPVAGQPFTLSVKLPYTGEIALQLPYAKPTAYGLGKSGWVSFTPAEGEMPSLEQLKDWVDESYRAQAPKRLVKQLDSQA
ncbi:MAG TPA: MmcQ/YjbR family DNA-binding protein [Allosphingosinicella sp.]|jgi:predicted DNA-binding protein (MmcQ/YjbR family)